MIRRLILPLIVAGALAASGCGSHGQVIRTEAQPADDYTKAERVNNGLSRTVQNWSTGED